MLASLGLFLTPETAGPVAVAASGDKARTFRTSLAIGLCCFIIYNANWRSIPSGDAYPARYLPFVILKYRTLVLDQVADVAAQGRGRAFWMVRVPGGHVISLYPVVVPVLIAPIYLPAVAYLNVRGWTDTALDRVARIMEKLSASLIAALSASLMFILLRRRASAAIATLLTIAYAFGTTTWVIGSQTLWQHGMAELLVIGALLVLTDECTPWRAIAAGLLCGLLAGTRPTDAILAAALGVYALFWSRRRAPLFVAGAVVVPALVLLYNLHFAHHYAGAYGVVGNPAVFFDHDLLSGLAGLLFSPARGLFIFSPFLLFLFIAWAFLPRVELPLSLAMTAGIVVDLLLYAKTDWRAGICFGPRFLTDILPMLLWLLVPVAMAVRGPVRFLFFASIAVAIAIEAIGAFCYTGETDGRLLFANDRRGGFEDMSGAWKWRNAPFIASLADGFAPRELTTAVAGAIDAITQNGRNVSTLFPGDPFVVEGWTLTAHTTPWQVGVAIDGGPITVTRSFVARPDVRDALHEASDAGWRIAMSSENIAAGDHQLAAFARRSEKGENFLVAQRALHIATAPAALTSDQDLENEAKLAASRIRAHQQPAGYWLTSHTTSTRYMTPRDEMNTFTTSLLVDLLDPVAATFGVQDNVKRAREHLMAQIEADGLVRYHGLPTGPGMGTLGCPITPDADDTSLVWRIAPRADRSALKTALATMNRYRTSDGLYRTWLAPKEQYSCIDPGKDPDPADIAIQMHVLLLLAKADPPAARALCSALTPHVGEDRVWVYYRLAPLVPMLRLGDVRSAGCKLTLPESRMQTRVAGQDIWVSAVRLLDSSLSAGAPKDRLARIRQVLDTLAKDDFSLVQTNPPLLYHNDLSASVSRYYWSEDAGYALWLRLYDEYARLQVSPHA